MWRVRSKQVLAPLSTLLPFLLQEATARRHHPLVRSAGRQASFRLHRSKLRRLQVSTESYPNNSADHEAAIVEVANTSEGRVSRAGSVGVSGGEY